MGWLFWYLPTMNKPSTVQMNHKTNNRKLNIQLSICKTDYFDTGDAHSYIGLQTTITGSSIPAQIVKYRPTGGNQSSSAACWYESSQRRWWMIDRWAYLYLWKIGNFTPKSICMRPEDNIHKTINQDIRAYLRYWTTKLTSCPRNCSWCCR